MSIDLERLDEVYEARDNLWKDLRNARGYATVEVGTMALMQVLAYLELHLGPVDKK
jgi:hypothetical protein